MSATNKFIIWLSRVWYVAWVLPVPIGYLIWKYNRTTTTTVDITTNSMPLWILVLIIIFSTLLVALVGGNLILTFLDYIKKNPFGFITTTLFAALVLLITLNGMGMLDKAEDLIRNGVTTLLNDMEVWKGSLIVITYYVVIGFAGGAIGFVYEIVLKLKSN